MFIHCFVTWMKASGVPESRASISNICNDNGIHPKAAYNMRYKHLSCLEAFYSLSQEEFSQSLLCLLTWANSWQGYKPLDLSLGWLEPSCRCSKEWSEQYPLHGPGPEKRAEFQRRSMSGWQQTYCNVIKYNEASNNNLQMRLSFHTSSEIWRITEIIPHLIYQKTTIKLTETSDFNLPFNIIGPELGALKFSFNSLSGKKLSGKKLSD